MTSLQDIFNKAYSAAPGMNLGELYLWLTLIGYLQEREVAESTIPQHQHWADKPFTGDVVKTLSIQSTPSPPPDSATE